MAPGVLRVLGVDPGSQATGFGVLEVRPAGPVLVEQGTIRPRPGEALPRRLLRIRDGLAEVIARSGAAEVSVETLFLGRNPRSAHVLAQVRGVVLLAAAQAGCEVFEYSPSQVKQAVTGHGRADKDQVRNVMALLLSLERAPRSRDAADALAAAWCHAARRSLARRLDPAAGAGRSRR